MKNQNKKLKILEITAFSSGICGLWQRVLSESKLLARKYDVTVFSSNIHRGTGKKEIAKKEEIIDKVKTRRFSTFFQFGENTFFWNYEKQALQLKPQVIITHAYRQYYSTLALKISRKLKIPCFLVTHAPFLDKKLRGWKENLAVFLYDNLIGKRILNSYDKIIAITKWEIPHLLKLGVKKQKIVYIPNGIPKEFFTQKRIKEKKNTILFLGRIAPIKSIETLIKAISELKNMKLNLIGPVEEPYGASLVKLIKKLKLNSKVKFLPAVYDLKEKIRLIDENEIFVLPSKREGMSQSLIEALARGKIAISSTNNSGKEIIQNNKNGFLFDIGNHNQLSQIIKTIQNMPDKERNKIKNQALNSVKQFFWDKLIKKIEKTIKK